MRNDSVKSLIGLRGFEFTILFVKTTRFELDIRSGRRTGGCGKDRFEPLGMESVYDNETY